MQHDVSLKRKRPILRLDSQLQNIPVMFQRDVLPHLVLQGFGTCWIWCGPVDNDGYPRIMRGGSYKYMRKYTASMFWEIPDDCHVRMTCQNVNCLNPAHMFVCKDPRKQGYGPRL